MRLFVLASLVVLLAILPARAQIADPDTLYDAGSLSFSYVQTPFPNYSGSFAAEGDGLLPDGTLPPGATDNSNPNGGTNGAGMIDIRNISVPESSEVSIQFDVTLASSLPEGTVVTNQADLLYSGTTLIVSDDPFVNGQSSPDIVGDEDPTVVQIASVQDFQVEKVSAYLDGELPAVTDGPGVHGAAIGGATTVVRSATLDAASSRCRSPRSSTLSSLLQRKP